MHVEENKTKIIPGRFYIISGLLHLLVFIFFLLLWYYVAALSFAFGQKCFLNFFCTTLLKLLIYFMSSFTLPHQHFSIMNMLNLELQHNICTHKITRKLLNSSLLFRPLQLLYTHKILWLARRKVFIFSFYCVHICRIWRRVA